jgi:hypothetical protein
MKVTARIGVRVGTLFSICCMLALAQIISGAYYDDALILVNQQRARHRAPPIKINITACEWCKACALWLLERNIHDHSCPQKTPGWGGENIMYGAIGVEDDAAYSRQAIEGWYTEIARYSFMDPLFMSPTMYLSLGHFMTNVQLDASHLGIGVGRNTTSNNFVTVGQFLYLGDKSELLSQARFAYRPND